MPSNPMMSKLSRLSFFKICFGDLIFTKLRVPLPPAFLKNLRRINFPTESTIALKSDGGVTWKVKMERMEGDVYFTDGWEKVWKDMNLEMGDFLVFYLVGDAAFEIRAYDMSCCERCFLYSSSRSQTDPNGDGNGIESSDDNLEVEEEKQQQQQQDQEDENDDGEEDIPDMPISRKNGCRGKAKQRNAEVKVTREKVEKEVIGKKKSHFVKFTQPASTRSYCVLPVWFAEEIHQVCKDDEVLIKDPVGREWVVKMKYRESPNRRYDLTTGWKEFRNANKLAVGDTLEFNHIKDCTIAVKVLPKCNSSNKHLRDQDSPNLQLNPHKKMKICKASSLRHDKKNGKGIERSEETVEVKEEKEEEDDDSDSNYEDEDDDGQEEEEEENEDGEEDIVFEPDMPTSKKRNWGLKAIKREEALGRAKSYFVSTNPHFIMRIPAPFIRKYKLFKGVEGAVELHSGGRVWSVRYHSNFKTRLFWRNFALDNGLVVGDVCAFELKRNVKQLSFQVTIFRTSSLLSF